MLVEFCPFTQASSHVWWIQTNKQIIASVQMFKCLSKVLRCHLAKGKYEEKGTQAAPSLFIHPFKYTCFSQRTKNGGEETLVSHGFIGEYFCNISSIFVIPMVLSILDRFSNF